jgi:hypothetical protein
MEKTSFRIRIQGSKKAPYPRPGIRSAALLWPKNLDPEKLEISTVFTIMHVSVQDSTGVEYGRQVSKCLFLHICLQLACLQKVKKYLVRKKWMRFSGAVN